MATGLKVKRAPKVKTKEMPSQDDSSESEIETEPAKKFHRRISTNKEIKTSVGHYILHKTVYRLYFVQIILTITC